MIFTVAVRNQQGDSYYVPSTNDDEIKQGLSALQHEGSAFWSDLKDSALQNFRRVSSNLELPESEEIEFNDIFSDSDSSDSDNE